MTEEGGAAPLPYSGELWRKALHLLSLSIPIGLLILGRTTALYVLVPLTLVFVLVEIGRIRFQPVRNLVHRIFGFMMRPEEIPLAPAPIHFNGATWVLLSACVLIAIFEPQVAAAAIVIGLIGDAAAALVGRRWGRHPIGRSGRTVEGTIAFVAAALPVTLLLPEISPIGAPAAVVVAALVEGFGTPFNDNLSVPLSAAVVLTLI